MTILGEYLSELILSQLEKRKPKPVPKGLSLATIYERANANHILYLVLSAMSQLELSQEEMKLIQKQLISRTILSENQIWEIKRLQEAFEREKIKNQPLKGALIKTWYPIPEYREMSDIDILVDDSDMNKIQSLMESLGYTLVQKEVHHDIYSKDKILCVELHRFLYSPEVDRIQHHYFGSFEHSIKDDDKEYCYHYSNDDLYIYMIAHMAKHFYETGCGIRNLVDIYVMKHGQKCALHQDYINEKLKYCGLLSFAEHMEKMSQVWLENRESDEFYDQLFEYMISGGTYGKCENGLWNKYAKSKSISKRHGRIALKLWYYFPPLYYMKEYYTYLYRIPILLPWAWLVRGIRGIIGHKGKDKKEVINKTDLNQIAALQKVYREMKLNFHIK